MGLLTKSVILAADDLKREAVPVPEWGGDVFIRSMTGAERDAFENAQIEGRGKDRKVNLANLRARLVAATACDGEGKLLFSKEDAAALGGKSSAALDRCFEVAQRLSRLSREDVEALAKNS